MADEVLIGGRRFLQVPSEDLTVGQHLHYERLVAAAGFRDLPSGPGESPEAYGQRLLAEMLRHGDVLLQLIGTVLIPHGRTPKEWTPDMARETALFLSTLPGEENLRQIHQLVAVLYLDFFGHGLASSKSSTSSRGEDRPETEVFIPGGPIDTDNGPSWSVN
jgi:hypothetical protein